MKFYFSSINLWCNKNLVDLEFIIWEILSYSSNKDFDIRYFENSEDDDVEFVIINTCWFLSTSREEAENTLAYFNDLWKKIILIWCYIEVADKTFIKNLSNLYKMIPFIDYNSVSDILWLSIANKLKVSKFVKDKKIDSYLNKLNSVNKWDKAFIWKWDEIRAYFNAPFGYEYVKIAEWCDNKCTFCIIPQIRWWQKSRNIEDIVSEVESLIDNWIREIVFIAQDTTRYWVDNYNKPSLLDLLSKVDNLKWDFKFRILYMYPDNLSLEHLNSLKSLKKFIPYFDIPFQHVSESVLKKMGRFYNEKWIFEILDFINKNFKEFHIRTQFIVGFPWETDADFDKLLSFIKKYKFDSIALFEYHDEKLAASSKLNNKVSHEIALSRINKLDTEINRIYKEKAIRSIWKEFNWYIEWFEWNRIYVRRELRAPEIDDLDEIKKSQLIWSKDFDIWDYIKYRL